MQKSIIQYVLILVCLLVISVLTGFLGFFIALYIIPGVSLIYFAKMASTRPTKAKRIVLFLILVAAFALAYIPYYHFLFRAI